MAIKFQYNKTSLNNLNKQLKMRKNALPTLKNKESALRLEVKKAKDQSEIYQASCKWGFVVHVPDGHRLTHIAPVIARGSGRSAARVGIDPKFDTIVIAFPASVVTASTPLPGQFMMPAPMP